jgi:hypothetical protein
VAVTIGTTTAINPLRALKKRWEQEVVDKIRKYQVFPI